MCVSDLKRNCSAGLGFTLSHAMQLSRANVHHFMTPGQGCTDLFFSRLSRMHTDAFGMIHVGFIL